MYNVRALITYCKVRLLVYVYCKCVYLSLKRINVCARTRHDPNGNILMTIMHSTSYAAHHK